MLGVFVSARSALEQHLKMPVPCQLAGKPQFGHVVPGVGQRGITSMTSSVLARLDNHPSDEASRDRHPSRTGASGVHGWARLRLGSRRGGDYRSTGPSPGWQWLTATVTANAPVNG